MCFSNLEALNFPDRLGVVLVCCDQQFSFNRVPNRVGVKNKIRKNHLNIKSIFNIKSKEFIRNQLIKPNLVSDCLS